MLKRLTREKQVGVLSDNKFIISPSTYIQIPSNYPFTCPMMYIDNVDHVRVLTKRFTTYKSFIDLYHISIVCFCCSTLTCDWSPCNTCHDLYDEYVTYNNKLKLIAAAKTYTSSSSFDDLVLTTIVQFLL
jgi:hypothetical protein